MDKKYMPIFISFAIMIALLAGAFAFTAMPGTIPNPGHALSEIQGYFQSDASLLESMPKFQQRISSGCNNFEGIKSVGVEGTVTCETGLQGRVTGSCPSAFISAIQADGTVACDPDSTLAVVNSSCPAGQIARSIAANGTLTCSEPIGTLCNYNSTGRMYSVGAKCNPVATCLVSGSNQVCVCQAGGAFNCYTGESYPCPGAC